MIENFKQLDVYKRAFEISTLVHQVSLEFPKIEQYSLADQMRRASRGICANIAEGFGKQRSSKAEFKRFLLMALGSAHEMLVWIDYCQKFEYVSDILAKSWLDEYEVIIKMLNSLYNKV